MSQLEVRYPQVKFVYMTGHVDIWDDADNKASNKMIRDFCTANDKILYDFADIERYDPDGTYFEFVNDSCDYYSAPGGTYLGNWAAEWQAGHTEGVDWYDCSSAHSEVGQCVFKFPVISKHYRAQKCCWHYPLRFLTQLSPPVW